MDINMFLGSEYYIPDYQREYSWEENELDDFEIYIYAESLNADINADYSSVVWKEKETNDG